MKLSLVDNWTEAWKWISVHAATLILVWNLTSEADQRAILSLVPLITSSQQLTALLALVGLIGRFVKQTKSTST